MNYEICRLNDRTPVYPTTAIEGWPSTNTTSETVWTESRVRFALLLGQLESFASSDHQILKREIQPDKASTAIYTVEDVLWQILAHNSYHISQVAMIRRCLGAWPPRGGRDSW